MTLTKAIEEAYEDNPPDPSATIEALRSLGYSTEAAIADLVDNSIAAGAAKVQVRMHWAGADSWCSIMDDGSGMSEPELRQAMRIGAKDPLATRSEADLGRFGMGLKTASFSQAREVTVATRRKARGALLFRTWDLDHVRRSGKWQMRRVPPKPVSDLIAELLGKNPGTLVVWRQLTRVVDALLNTDERNTGDDFIRSIESVEWHLGMTFGRLLSQGTLALRLNGRDVEPWDPFLTASSFTQQLAEETLTVSTHRIKVKGYVLPHFSKLKEAERELVGGPRGWNNQQGFYVYRRDRLISAGDWLSTGLTRGDDFNLARLAIDVPPELDHAWGLDVKKTSVLPPEAVRRDLKRIAEVTRRLAKRARSSRSTPLANRSSDRHHPLARAPDDRHRACRDRSHRRARPLRQVHDR